MIYGKNCDLLVGEMFCADGILVENRAILILCCEVILLCHELRLFNIQLGIELLYVIVYDSAVTCCACVICDGQGN